MARRRIGTGGVGTDMGSVKDVSAGEHSWNVKQFGGTLPFICQSNKSNTVCKKLPSVHNVIITFVTLISGIPVYFEWRELRLKTISSAPNSF